MAGLIRNILTDIKISETVMEIAFRDIFMSETAK